MASNSFNNYDAQSPAPAAAPPSLFGNPSAFASQAPTGFSNPAYNFTPQASAAPSASPFNPATAESGTGVQSPVASSNYQNMGGGWNPFQYATNAATSNLANILGAKPGQTESSGYGAPPPQNVLDFGNGLIGNAGLSQSFIDTFGLDRAKQMFGDMSKIASGGTTRIGTDPSLVGYNPAIAPTPVTAPQADSGALAGYNSQTKGTGAPAATQSPIDSYIASILGSGNGQNATGSNNFLSSLFGSGGGNDAYGSSGSNALMQLLGMFQSNPFASTGSNSSQTLTNLIQQLGGMPDQFSYSRPRYSLFY
jgi:hypothetical protein